MILSPRLSGEFIAKKSTHVTIKEEGLKKLSEILLAEVNAGKLSPEHCSQNEFHPDAHNSCALEWLFVVDTLNFCFWHYENEEGWMVNGKTGYFALCAAINRAREEKVDILNPKFYSTITEDQLKNILRSDNKFEVPLLKERINCLHEVGAVLIETFNGSFENCVKQAENSATKLLELIVENFRCFRDEAKYKGQRVAIYKRAQILIGDVWSCFRNKGLGYFKDIEELTMFADYRVPQTLLWYNVFHYSDKLLSKLKDNVLLKNADEEEVEIRGCSIHAVELVRARLSNMLDGKEINAVLIDHFLWDFRRNHAKEILDKGLPFHKTFSIYY